MAIIGDNGRSIDGLLSQLLLFSFMTSCNFTELFCGRIICWLLKQDQYKPCLHLHSMQNIYQLNFRAVDFAVVKSGY